MNLNYYISQLLYSKNHVVIPNFGGFVCQDFRAEINEATQMFMPPSKRLSFQPAMASYDDSLLDAIVLGESMSRQAAKKWLTNITNQWLKTLANGEHVKLDDIGRLFKNGEGEFSFQADINANFDASSFGLSIFRFPELKGQKQSTIPLQGQLVKSVKNTWVNKYWQRAAVFIGVVGLFYLGTQKADFNSFDFASVNPLIFSKTVTVTPEVKPTEDKTIEITTPVIKEEVKKEVKEITPPVATETKATPVVVEKNKPYNIIVGAFGVKANADNYLAKLKREGNTNAISFYEKGLYKISVDQFVSKVEAKKSLRIFKQKTNKGAWIYKK